MLQDIKDRPLVADMDRDDPDYDPAGNLTFEIIGHFNLYWPKKDWISTESQFGQFRIKIEEFGKIRLKIFVEICQNLAKLDRIFQILTEFSRNESFFKILSFLTEISSRIATEKLNFKIL